MKTQSTTENTTNELSENENSPAKPLGHNESSPTREIYSSKDMH